MCHRRVVCYTAARCKSLSNVNLTDADVNLTAVYEVMTLDITSPCQGICKIDEPTQLCIGCSRNIDEITRWRGMDDEQKLAVLMACVERQQIPNNAGNSDKLGSMAAGEPGKASDGCE